MTEQKIAPVLSDERAEFEKWHVENLFVGGPPRDAYSRDEEGYYDDFDVQVAWRGYQAGKEQAALARVGAVRDQALEEAVTELEKRRRLLHGQFEALNISDADAVYGISIDAIRALKGTPAAALAEQRECGNGDCGWQGTTNRMCGTIGPLCPKCGETTERSLPQPSTNPGPLAAVEPTLDAEETDFVLSVIQNPGCKHPWGDRDYGRSGDYNESTGEVTGAKDPVWRKPEALGIIACVGSYKWEPTALTKSTVAAAVAAIAASKEGASHG